MSAKKKKKPLLQVQEQEQLVGSGEYLANREIDQIIKRGKDRLKHAITLSDEKLTKTKKQIVGEMATEMEKVGYPTNQICDRLTKSIKGLVSERTVQDALEAKYKDPEQMRVALLQNHDGRSVLAPQKQLKNKDIKAFTIDDIKLANATQLRKVAKYQMQRADYIEHQAKQQQRQKKGPVEDDRKDKEKLIEDLKIENARQKEIFSTFTKMLDEWLDPKYTDEQVGKGIRAAAYVIG